MAYRTVLDVRRTSSGYSIVHREMRRVLVKVVADKVYPNMWRVVEADGGLSDMVNLSRAIDAAMRRAATILDKAAVSAA
jgi:hypothetical protein